MLPQKGSRKFYRRSNGQPMLYCLLKGMADTENRGIVCLLLKEQSSSILKVVTLCWVVIHCLPSVNETEFNTHHWGEKQSTYLSEEALPHKLPKPVVCAKCLGQGLESSSHSPVDSCSPYPENTKGFRLLFVFLHSSGPTHLIQSSNYLGFTKKGAGLIKITN